MNFMIEVYDILWILSKTLWCRYFYNVLITQHAFQPNIDYGVIHIRHFIHIQFSNKKIELIYIPNIFKSIISSLPTYLNKNESPIICYEYNKPIHRTVLNYNKLATGY